MLGSKVSPFDPPAPMQELTLLEYDTLKYAPSELAAAAMLVALGHQEAAPAAAAHLSTALSAFSPMLER